jgi:uncharacterized protein (TIRG00374 family)
MAENKKRRLFSPSKIFFYILSIGIFVFVAIYFTEIKKDVKLFEKINPLWLSLALLGQAATYLFGALVYRRLLSIFQIKIKRAIWKLVQVNIVTLFFNQTVPSAGISGNTYFFNFLSKKKVPINQSVSVISTELLTFYAAMEIIIVAILIIVLFFLKAPNLFIIIPGIGFLVYLVFGLAVEFLSRERLINKIYRKLNSLNIFRKLATRIKKSVPGNISFSDVTSPLQFYRQNKMVIVQAVLLQLCIFSADGFTIFCLFKGLGVSDKLLTVPVAFVLTKIISLLPVSPGALILYEGSMVFFFSRLGVNVSAAIVVTLLYRALSFWLPIFIGLFLYRKLKSGK